MSRDALVIGINRYPGKPLPGSLLAPANDAEGVAQILEKYGDFATVKRFPETKAKPYKVCEKTPVRGRALKQEIVQLLNPTGTQVPDMVLLYFSGHGVRDQLGTTVEGYLATSDINPANDRFGVSLDWLRQQLEQSPVSHQVVILDCCHSGDLLNFDQLKTDKGGKGRYFVAACRDIESAYEESGSSIFTKALIEGLDPTQVPGGSITDADLTPWLNRQLKGSIQLPLSHNTGNAIRLTFTHQASPLPQPAPEPKKYVPRQGEKVPTNFVPRPKPFNAVKQMLLQKREGNNQTLVVSAIHGLGGIGKSVLAAALIADSDIQQRYPDGTLWITLGQQPELLPMLGGWIRALGDHNYRPVTAAEASAHLSTLLYDKQMLLVVDDVWNPVHADVFRVGGSRCRLLVTTREANIRDAKKCELDVMTLEQAMALLTNKLGDTLSEIEKKDAAAFAKRVGYLPLALELATAQIEEGLSWKELLEDFCQEVDRLESLDMHGHDDLPDDAERRKYSLSACFNLSLQRLTTEQRQHFAWLGVLPEDADITQVMAQTLWQMNERQAGSVLKTFRGKALLKGDRHAYRLHDLMHDLAVQLLTCSAAPKKAGDLLGLGITKERAHQQLLDRYRETACQGQWHTLKDDDYIYTYLTWHMLQADKPSLIHQLLQETTEAGRNGWYEACDALGKPAQFASDVNQGWQLATKQEPDLTKAIPLQVRYAFIRASLNSLADNIPADMVGGLLKVKKWQPAQALAYAQQTQDPWRRAEYLWQLVPYIPQALLPEVRTTLEQINDKSYHSFALARLATRFPELWPNVLNSIANIQDRIGTHRYQSPGFSYRAFALRKILPELPADYLPQVLSITKQIQNSDDRAISLIALAQHLPNLWDEALEITRSIQDEWPRASALSALAQHLPNLWDEALEITRSIQAEWPRASALSELAQHLPERLWDEALEITRSIQDEGPRASALSALAQHLPNLWDEALEITRSIQAEWQRARALSALAQHLPNLWDEALEITRSIQDEWQRASTLSALAQHLPERLWDEALEITRSIQDEGPRASALSALAQHLPERLWDEALEITRSIQAEWQRARALSALAQHLPERLWDEALEITRSIQAEGQRARALSALAQHLPERLWDEALEITRSIQDEGPRARALSALAQHLPNLWDEALETTRSIQAEWERASALSALAQHLPERLWDEALEITRSIQAEWERARALSALAQHLPERLWDEALEITRSIQAEGQRARALSALAQHLPNLWDEALEITRSIQDEGQRARALSALAQHLPNLWDEALEITRSIQAEWERARALSELAQHLPERLWDEALEITRSIQDEWPRARALSALAQHLPNLWDEALEITRSIQDEEQRARALSALAQHLPNLWDEALEITRSIQAEWERARALSELAQHLPERLWDEALEITRSIQDEEQRASALSELAQHLPERLWDEALEITRSIQDEEQRASALSALAQHLPERLWDEALEIAWNFKNKYYCANALQGLLPRLSIRPITFQLWTTILDTLAYDKRQQLITAFANLRIPIQTLGSDQTFMDALQATRDICKQWP